MKGKFVFSWNLASFVPKVSRMRRASVRFFLNINIFFKPKMSDLRQRRPDKTLPETGSNKEKDEPKIHQAPTGRASVVSFLSGDWKTPLVLTAAALFTRLYAISWNNHVVWYVDDSPQGRGPFWQICFVLSQA